LSGSKNQGRRNLNLLSISTNRQTTNMA